MKLLNSVYSLLFAILSVVALFGTCSYAAEESIYGGGEAYIDIPQPAQQIIVGILIIMIFVLLAAELCSPETLLLSALIICMMLQILTMKEALAGFSNQSMITIGALFIVVGGVEKSHMVDWLARKTFGSDGPVEIGKVRMYITCFLLSIFFNNTPLVAILLPVVKDWGRMRNIAASQLLMPLSYSVLAGSFISMIGTSTNLTLQGLMQADRGYSFSFFAPAPMGIVCFVGLCIYLTFAGPYLLPNEKVGLIRTARDKAATMMAEIYVSTDSRAAGKSIGEVMNSLGVAPSCMIKIRRRVNRDSTGGMTPAPSVDNLAAVKDLSHTKATDLSQKHGAPKTTSNILDVAYLKRTYKAWTSPGAKAKGSQEASATEVVEETEARRRRNTEEGIEEPDETQYTDIIAPSPHELVAPHDVLFVSSAQQLVEKMMKSIAGESKGLYILNSNALALPGFGTELLECVVSDTNPFLGQKVSQFSAAFAERYKAAIITVRGKDWFGENDAGDASSEDADAPAPAAVRAAEKAVSLSKLNSNEVDSEGIELGVAGRYRPVTDGDDGTDSNEGDLEAPSPSPSPSNVGSTVPLDGADADSSTSFVDPAVTVSDHALGYGDIILCVSHTDEVANLRKSRDFFVVSTVGSLPEPLDLFKSIPVAIFVAMLIVVATEQIEMCPASLFVAVIFLLGGWVKSKEVPDLVDLKLLIMIGSSISFAQAVTKTGLALEIAKTISSVDSGPQGLMFLVYALTLAITELISNNAAAALMYPIAVAIADRLEVSFKPFAMCVLMASTACFMCPIGYQTHMMVWAPGGYKFKDFLLFGLFPDVMYWVLSCLLIPAIYPF